MKFKNTLYIFYIFIFINFLSLFKNKYIFVSSDEFTENIKGNTLYHFDNYHCFIEEDNIFYYKYMCSYFVKPLIHNIDFSNKNIVNIDTNVNNFTSYLNILFYVYLFYSTFNLLYKSNTSDNNDNNIFSFLPFSKINIEKNTNNTTIDNFIGCTNIKKDINRIINQIKYNNIYCINDCELPKGLLLKGPAGCGKTHLVKTIINSTGINYLFTNGSEFNKMFVGAGSIMINNLFRKARENKPCLIFIDEADTIIKKRSYNDSSTSNEFNSTICKFLSELDSLKTESGVIVIFASNMDEQYIDKAMIRSGRIDLIINIDHPTLEERIDLFKMYLKNLYNENINLQKIAKLSYGLNGSDIKKIINNIKINKVYTELEYKPNDLQNDLQNNFNINITTEDIDNEINKCILGLERDRKINNLNRKIISYHEAGHAIMSFLLKDSILPSKICISITSKSLGYTMYHKDDDDLLLGTSINYFLREIMILYAGRSSEKIFLNEITCGAEDDYMKARKILKKLLMNGMLLSEYNYVESNDYKVPEEIEKILSIINKYMISKVDEFLNKYNIIIHQTAELILINNSITGDDIYDIFKNNNLDNIIQSIDIMDIYNEIMILIKN